METIFTKEDLLVLESKSISLETISNHINLIQNGVAKIICIKPAIVNDGILRLSEIEKEQNIQYFDANKSNFEIIKFVPASGAATRMFQFLIEFLSKFDPETDSINAYINKSKCVHLSVFLVGLRNFPFYNQVLHYLVERNPQFRSQTIDRQLYQIIETLINAPEFDFANKPKGVLPFHLHMDVIETPVHKHLAEVGFYKNETLRPKVHFTISKEHFGLFNKITNNFAEIDISFSYQEEKSDTIAVRLDNTLYKDSNDILYLRPSGHGALIENLNNLQEEIIFIKNIDNVAQNDLEAIYQYKKMLGGILMQVQQEIFDFLRKLENTDFSDLLIQEVAQFLKEKLCILISDDFYSQTNTQKTEYLIAILNRPIRVCGMVKNEDEPGGGPFWVKSKNGNISLQIVEGAQIDLENEKQLAILNAATHFNPVDIVCAVKNYKGEKFNLLDFVDSDTGFVVEKSIQNTVVKAYELPGLWNGAMANWISIFVEVPIFTFNPVKTCNDLLKSAHQ